MTPKVYVDNAIDEIISIVRKNQNNDFNNFNLTNINSITLNTQAVNDNHDITKAYVDQFHQDDEQSRRDLGIDFYIKPNDFDELDLGQGVKIIIPSNIIDIYTRLEILLGLKSSGHTDTLTEPSNL